MVLIVTGSNQEHGYSFPIAGVDPPEFIDLDGLQLIPTRYAGTVDDLNLFLSVNSNEAEQDS